MTGLREQKKQALRQRLYEAAIAAFERDGFEQASVDAICSEVGVAKGTFFNHFPCKADVIAAWYAEQLGRSLPIEHADRWLSPALTMVELVQAQPVLWAAKQRLVTQHAELAHVEVQGDARLREHYRGLLLDSGLDQAGADQGAQWLVALITGSCREWQLQHMADQAPESLALRLQQRIDGLRRLLLTAAGRG